MATLSQIRKALATTIKTYAVMDIAAYDTVADMTQVPAVVVEPLNADFAVAFGGSDDSWKFHVFVMVGRTNMAQGQNQLDDLVGGSGPNSIRKILFDHSDLGLGDGTDCFVQNLRGYGGAFAVARIEHIGAVLTVHVETHS